LTFSIISKKVDMSSQVSYRQGDAGIMGLNRRYSDKYCSKTAN
jgi:hypothetical protein